MTRDPACAVCGHSEGPLATVMDPFMDRSYFLCATHLAPVHEGIRDTLREVLAVGGSE